MFAFKTSHVMKNPAGNYSVVGSVPITCLTLRHPTVSDVMGGRTMTVNGETKGWTTRVFQTPDEAFEAVRAGNGTLCDCPACLHPTS